MAIPDNTGLISFIGILVQSTVTLLTVLLCWLLGRYAARRAYFTAWTAAWSVLLVGIIALVLRYNIVPNFDRTLLENGLAVRSFYFVYQFSKLLFAALMVLGTLMFVQPVRPIRFLMIAVPVLGLFAALTVASSTNLNRIVAWQAAVIVPAFATCSFLLYTLAPERRTLGTRLVAGFFTGLALVWFLYFVSFAQVKIGGQAQIANPFSVFIINNSFIDALLGMLLTVGMVVLLMEGVTREVEETRTERLRDVALSEARLSSVIRSATDAIVTLDSDRQITLFNPAAEEIFRTSAVDATDSSFERFVIPAHREQLAALLREDAPRGTPLPLALRHPYTGLRGGEEFPMELSVSDFILSGSRSQVLIVRDLTERKRAELERDDLQAKLAHAHRMETVGQLVSGVAHGLNNPLTAVLSFSEILLHDQRAEHDRLALSTIREQAQRCRSVVRNLLTFIREGSIRRQPVLLQEVLARVARAFEPEFAQFGISLTMTVEESLPLLEVDPEGLEQVLTNLISNAVHAIGTFGEIKLSARGAGENVVITVEDSGAGIPPDLLPRIFEPFFGGTRSTQGTGLGLCVAQSIVERHGGSLAVENRELPHRGARFIFTLPIHPRRTPEEATESLRQENGSGGPSRKIALVGSGKRVLLIEDEKAIRTALRRFFERSGWRVEEAEAGAIGLGKLLESAGEVPYDLVISDLKMPDMGGIELHNRLRAVRPDLLRRFVFVTGDVASPEAAAFVAKTTCPVLEKPFELSALSAMVIRVVGH